MGRTEADDRHKMGASVAPELCARAAPKAELEGSRRKAMPQSVYKVIELIGTSTKSWDDAAKAAVERAAETLRDLLSRK